MAYTKQSWTNDEVITATKLNHIEDGIYNLGGDTASNLAYAQAQISSLSGRIAQNEDDIEELQTQITYLQTELYNVKQTYATKNELNQIRSELIDMINSKG